MGRPIKSASACPHRGQDDEEKGVSSVPPDVRRGENFGGCPSVPLRMRDTGDKYAGDRKTDPR